MRCPQACVEIYIKRKSITSEYITPRWHRTEAVRGEDGWVHTHKCNFLSAPGISLRDTQQEQQLRVKGFFVN